jgi:hypothetical protein
VANFLFGPKHQYTKDDGTILAGGYVYVYEVGTTTGKNSYPTVPDALAGTNALTSPVSLDSAGRATIVLVGNNKIVLKDSSLNTIWTLDNVNVDTTLQDANGNEWIQMVSTSNAVNQLKISNAATGNAVVIDTAGDDATPNLAIKADGGSGTVTITNPTLSGTVTNTGDSTIGGALTVTGASTFNAATSTVMEDSRTNTVVAAQTLTATTSGTPAAGIGTGVDFKAESGDENPSILGSIDFRFTDVTAGSEDSDFVISTRAAGASKAESYKFRRTGTGSYTHTGAPTSARTITWPDSDITIGGMWTLITSSTASASAAIDFTSLSTTYSRYMVLITKLYAGTDAQGLNLAVSTDNLSSVISTGYYHGVTSTTSAGVANSSEDNANDWVVLPAGISNVSTETFNGVVEIYNAGVASYAGFTASIAGIDSNTRGRICSSGGVVTTSSINSIRFAMTSGNIAGGSFKLYGLLS